MKSAIGREVEVLPLMLGLLAEGMFVQPGMNACGIKCVDRFTDDDFLKITGCQSCIIEKCEDLLHVSVIIKVCYLITTATVLITNRMTGCEQSYLQSILASRLGLPSPSSRVPEFCCTISFRAFS